MFHSNLPISIALQGGGSHGAFTAGVLQKLAECESLNIEAISGTSSGAVNACLVGYGYSRYGYGKNTIKPLDNFWEDLGKHFEQLFTSFDSVLSPLLTDSNSLGLDYFLNLTNHIAPFQFNPTNLNPLKELLNKHIDFNLINSTTKLRLFIAATNIRTHGLRLFENHELTADHILASACLPSIHHSIKIDNDMYWDGGYSGNPVIQPLIFNCHSKDIIIVLIQPLEYNDIPTTKEQIRERISELSFASTFRREMRAIALSQQFIENDVFHLGKLDKKLSGLRFHIIHASEYIKNFAPKTRYNASPTFLNDLKKAGYECATNWLEKYSKDVGVKSSVDIKKLFL